MNTNLAAPNRTRMAALDGARLLSVLAVIYLHTPRSVTLQDSTMIGRFAVPFFTLAAVLLVFRGVERRPDISFSSYAWPRAKRLYGLFLIWSCVYFAVRLAGALLMKNRRPSISLLDLLWNGTAQHLWFLPFILIVTLLAFAVAKGLQALPSLRPWAMSIGVLLGCLMAWHVPHSLRGWGFTIEVSYDAITALLWGISLALFSARVEPGFFERPAIIGVGFVTLIVCQAANASLGRHLLLEHLAGLGLLLASLNDSQGRLSVWMAKGGALSLSLYLVHILWVEGFQDIAQKFGFAANWQRDVTVFVAAVVASFVTVLLLNLSRHTRRLIA